MGLLEGKIALITGAARGQGRAHAVESARHGADVILFDISKQIDTVGYPLANADDMAETVRQVEELGRRVLHFDADVRDQTQVDGVVSAGISEFGKIDILIANHGIWSLAPFWEMNDDTWNDMIDINLTGVWRVCKAVTPHMIERQSGSIVITSSVNGHEAGAAYAHYTAAKHGILGLMKTIAIELAPHGIRCNAISPGTVLSGMSESQYAYDMFAGHPGGTREDMLNAGYHYHALKGQAQLPPERIADTAVYLNSDLASSVTGVTIPVDAGHLAMVGYNHNPVR